MFVALVKCLWIVKLQGKKRVKEKSYLKKSLPFEVFVGCAAFSLYHWLLKLNNILKNMWWVSSFSFICYSFFLLYFKVKIVKSLLFYVALISFRLMYGGGLFFFCKVFSHNFHRILTISHIFWLIFCGIFFFVHS